MAEGDSDVTLNTLHRDLGDVRGDLAGVRADLAGVRADLGDVRADLGDVRADLAGVRGDLADLKGEIRDLKTTVITGFAGMPTRESSEEMVRLLRESNRLQEARFTQLDGQIREHHLETQQVLHTLANGQLALTTEVRNLATEARGTSSDLKALVARIDALIRGRNNGQSSA